MINSLLNSNIVDGWFYEKDTFAIGHRQTVKVKEILYHERSKFQDVMIFDTETFGRFLILDGAIQCSENDEFVYQEMITFLPINSHPKPSEVLVIGGGDGGVLRELDRHPLVKNVTLCEIDEDVINVSKKYLPNMAKGFTSKKAKIIIEDAFEHIQRNTHKYDVIICDLTDPAGSPSEKLYTSESISLMHNSLKQDGILCLQSECFWMSLNLISNLMKYCTSKFSVCRYASAYTPFYLFGQLGFLLCSKSKDIEFDKPSFIMDPSIYGLKYYSAAIHQASFILPNFVNETIYNTPSMVD